VRQSGIKDFRLADPWEHSQLFPRAHRDALAIMGDDPGLETSRGRALRFHHALFGHSSRAKTIDAG
jgi:RecG-like helicase